jgi:serine/threonine protein kinase
LADLVGHALSCGLSPRPLNAAHPVAAGTLFESSATLPVGVSMSASAPDPSTAPSLARFRETALASGLVQPGQVEAAEREVRLIVDAAACEPAAWDQAVADKLISQGVLTKFQAREMLAGRRRFRLGQYTVLDEIGRGGMGQVFLAEHAMMGRHVALKVLPRAKSTPEYEAAFQREIRVLARLDHENLVRALDAGHDAKVYYLVTELVPGLDLRRQVLKYGPLDELAAASVITQAAQGLAYAHEQGLVHRDVKPGNVLVTQDGRVKVLDLGLAGSMLDAENTSTTMGRVVGTLDYMSPEQIRSPDTVGPAADVYGLGCTLYFALTGQVPFPGGTRKEKAQRQLADFPIPLAQLAPHVDAGLRRVVEGMMKKSPDERIGTATEVIQRLRPWTPRSAVPMSRSPVSADRRPADATRPLPPPLPAVRDSSVGGSASSPSASGTAGPDEESWPMIVNPQMPDIGRPARGAARAPASGWLGRLGALVANAGAFVRGRSRR